MKYPTLNKVMAGRFDNYSRNEANLIGVDPKEELIQHLEDGLIHLEHQAADIRAWLKKYDYPYNRNDYQMGRELAEKDEQLAEFEKTYAAWEAMLAKVKGL